MKNQNVTPPDRDAIIVRRAHAGERKSDLAEEYDLSPSRITQIIKEAEKNDTTASPSLEDLSDDELRQRQNELKDDIIHTNGEKRSRWMQCQGLEKEIELETAQLEIITDPSQREASETLLQGMRAKVAALEDHTRLDRTLIEAHDARTQLAKEYVRSGLQIPGDLFFRVCGSPHSFERLCASGLPADGSLSRSV